jgi:hypothetical protein
MARIAGKLTIAALSFSCNAISLVPKTNSVSLRVRRVRGQAMSKKFFMNICMRLVVLRKARTSERLLHSPQLWILLTFESAAQCPS